MTQGDNVQVHAATVLKVPRESAVRRLRVSLCLCVKPLPELIMCVGYNMQDVLAFLRCTCIFASESDHVHEDRCRYRCRYRSLRHNVGLLARRLLGLSQLA